MVKWLFVGLAWVLVWSPAVQARVTLPRLDQHLSAMRAKVMVLGTVHLDQLSGHIDPRALDPLLDRLAAYKPDVITVEAISGPSCAMMRHYPTLYDPDSLGRFCSALEEARAATGLDVPSAVALVHKTLKEWPARPAPAQRRHLGALFMAAGDRTSALVQWLQLPSSERHAGEGLDDALVRQLQALAGDQNENALIAARLAARLGLQRVFPVDDHTGDAFPVDDVKAYAAALEGAWNSSRSATGPVRKHEKALSEAGDMLGLYRYINRPDVLHTVIKGDFGAALRDASPQHYGQLYVAGWETRNLRMVASVREAFVERPGAHVLSLVGSEHKPWFDGLLGQMQDVDVVDVERVLGSPAK